MTQQDGSASRYQKIPLPLHCYDESGHIKPPLMLYLCAIWLCKGLVVLILSASLRDNATALISLFYPDTGHWYQSVIPAMFGITSLLILSLRDTLRARNALQWQRQVKHILLAGLSVSVIIQLRLVAINHGQFEWASGILLLVSLACAGYLLRSRHVVLFVRDAND
ncbi:DUF2919 family protein [Alteromonas oceanisediminis]|uniref:DUF2919 family protein n=1 Tax=Alteromonas oceanisediminis TaxID=2836180 RepID=UPI001BD94573|nr:DUF2919 family protein [Alteromonas oceanisediminis]MBT0586495.1 DUF2919 family protein [Alteromonas oceanisediminis]